MSKMSLDGEPHAETTFLSQSFEHGKNDSRSQRSIQTQQRSSQHSEVVLSEKRVVVDMFAKSGFGTQQIRSQVQKHAKHMFEIEIKSQEPKNSLNEFRESKSGYFRGKLSAEKCR